MLWRGTDYSLREKVVFKGILRRKSPKHFVTEKCWCWSKPREIFFFETSSRPFIFNGRHSTRFHMVAADIYNTQSSQVSQTRMEVGSHKKETRAMQATFY